jgi:hypothetical protein
MPRPPTDRRILAEIYKRYQATFADFDLKTHMSRPSKVWVPIDVYEIGSALGVEGDIVFGRLYYHLNPKHRFKAEDGSTVMPFAIEAGGIRHCVNFPMIESLLADLEDRNIKFLIPTALATFSTLLSVVALVLAAT